MHKNQEEIISRLVINLTHQTALNREVVLFLIFFPLYILAFLYFRKSFFGSYDRNSLSFDQFAAL